MRLWHYDLIKCLPNSQLLAQWRELNSIYKKQDKHILINYVYEYPKRDLYIYSKRVIDEITSRGMHIHSMSNFNNYFSNIILEESDNYYKPFIQHHNNAYLTICYYNLYEKYLRGQKDFTTDIYNKLENFCEIYI